MIYLKKTKARSFTEKCVDIKDTDGIYSQRKDIGFDYIIQYGERAFV